MLARLNSYIQHQDFCDPYEELWPPKEAVQIILGDSGHSCKDVCEVNGKLFVISGWIKVS